MRFVGIDPATRTGFVAIDIHGNVLAEAELKGKGKAEKGGITIEQLSDLGHQLYKLLLPGDEIAMEDAALGTQKGISTGMIHGVLRYMIHRRGLRPNFLMPTSVKKYVGVTGWSGPEGNKQRLTDKEKKAAVAVAVKDMFGYTNKSDNITDAYIIARVALNLYLYREFKPMLDRATFQKDVVENILRGK